MDVTVRAYDPTRPPDQWFGAQQPLDMADAFYEFNKARKRGAELVFVLEGQDAERGVEVIKEVLNAPPDPAESAREFLGGEPRRRVEVAEITTTVGASQGLECTGYWILNNRTKHLRDRLYIVVREGLKEFRPVRWWEHFPVLELHEKGTTDYPTIGKDGGEIAFICYAPPESGAAREGAAVIAETMRDLGPLLSGHPFGRIRAFISADCEYRGMVPVKGPLHRGVGKDEDPPDSTPAAYRPPPDAIPLRPNGPKPSRPKTFWEVVETKKREMLARWGMNEEYDRMQAQQRRRDAVTKDAGEFARKWKPWEPPKLQQPGTIGGGFHNPWKESPWK